MMFLSEQMKRRSARGQGTGTPAKAMCNGLSVVQFRPVIALERVDEREENAEEDQHDDADVDPFVLHGLAHVIEVIDQVRDESLVLDGGQRPRRAFRQRLYD